MRAMLEAKAYDNNCFLTLTYSPEYLPKNGSLDYERPVKFMKDLRERFGSGIRSFGCAEYGDQFSRPHYHLCLFNFKFPDQALHKKTKTGHFIFTSEKLSQLWPDGHSSIGSLSFESAAYVARYVTKKITGPSAREHYEVLNEATGELTARLPERAICVSRMPGLGKPWYDQHGEFLRTHDFVVLRGKKMRPPKYFDALFEKLDPERFKIVKEKRRQAGIANAKELDNVDLCALQSWRANSGDFSAFPPTRLAVMEKVQELKFKQLIRGYEK